MAQGTRAANLHGLYSICSLGQETSLLTACCFHLSHSLIPAPFLHKLSIWQSKHSQAQQLNTLVLMHAKNLRTPQRKTGWVSFPAVLLGCAFSLGGVMPMRAVFVWGLFHSLFHFHIRVKPRKKAPEQFVVFITHQAWQEPMC